MQSHTSIPTHFPIFLAIVPLLGYWALYLTYWTRYHTYRLSGQGLLLSSSIAGLLILAAARLITVSLDPSFTSCFKDIIAFWDRYAPFEYSGTLLCAAVVSTILPFLVNLLLRKHYCAEAASAWYGDLIEGLLQECIEHDRLAELSLRNGKSYVGFVLNSGISTMGDSDIELIPLASGYRHNKTRKLKLTTFYGNVLMTRLDELSLDDRDFRVVLPMSEILSARIFDPNAYEALENVS